MQGKPCPSRVSRDGQFDAQCICVCACVGEEEGGAGEEGVEEGPGASDRNSDKKSEDV